MALEVHTRMTDEHSFARLRDDASRGITIHGAPALFQYLDDMEIHKQKIESNRIADAIATSTERAETSWLIEMHRAIENSLAHLQTYKLSNYLEDLEKVISEREKIIDLSAKGDPLFPGQLASLGYILHLRFKHAGQLQDITRAIDLYRESSYHVPSSPEKIRLLFSLAWALKERHDHKHEQHDIDEAIAIVQDLEDSEDSECGALDISSTLSIFHLLRLMSNGEWRDNEIRQALAIYHRSVDNRPDNGVFIFNLGTIYRYCFSRTKELLYIDMAIEAIQKALLMSQPLYIWPVLFMSYAEVLEDRYDETQNLEDLHNAIAHAELAIQACRDNNAAVGSHNRSEGPYYRSLGALYYQCHMHTSNMDDVENSIRALKEAELRTPEGNPDLPKIITELAQSLCLRDSLEAISAAISCYQRAVDIAACNGVENPRYLHFLGKTLFKKYKLSGEQQDFDDGVNVLWMSVGACTENHPVLRANLVLLSEILEQYSGMEKLGLNHLKIIDAKISAMERTIDTMASRKEMEEEMLVQLGILFDIRYKVSRHTDDIERAISLCRQVTLESSAKPLTRFHSGRIWAELCEAIGDTSRILDAYKLTFDNVIPLLAWIGHTVEQRYKSVMNLEQFVRRAAAVAIQCRENDFAIQWLEHGRSIVWNQIHRFRIPLDNLRKVDPVLCEEVEKTGRSLNDASMRTPSQHLQASDTKYDISVHDKILRHHNLVKKWGSLLLQIRGTPGFENFLQYRPASSFFRDLGLSLPRDGFVIIINVQPSVSNTLILSGFMPNAVYGGEIRNFNYATTVFLRETLNKHVSSHAARMRTVRTGRLAAKAGNEMSVKDILRVLWYNIVKPTFEAIGLQPSSNPPRIWWCPTGPLAFLPLHAAGDYSVNAPPGSNIMEYAISSYTPTLTTLARGLSKHRQQQAQAFQGLLAVSVPQVHDLPPIPNTSEEIRVLEKLFMSSSQSFKCTEGADATADKVLQDMSLYSWIHLSCHALQNNSPLKSAFYLHDRPLTLRDIMQQPLPHAQFAFLSACETGKGDKKLSEEAVHLAGGMLAAGYTSIVATMWSINDNYAPLVTNEFYTYILQKGDRKLDHTGSVIAAHQSVASRIRELFDNDTGSTSYYKGTGVTVEYNSDANNYISMLQNTVASLIDSDQNEDEHSFSTDRGEAGTYPNCTKSAAALHHAIRCLRASVGDEEEGLMAWVPYIHVGI